MEELRQQRLRLPQDQLSNIYKNFDKKKRNS